MRRSTPHIIGGISTLAAGILGFCLWSAFVPNFINGFQALTVSVCVAAAGAVWWAIADRMRRAEPRFPAGFCQLCSYDLTGNTSGICPECGTPVQAVSRGDA